MISNSVSIFLPTSLVADASELKQKTIKVGLIGRALAIFRVGEVYVYNDDDSHIKNQTAEAKLITTLLRYMETPQYLRKFLFPRMNELQYVGLLPPLRTPHHPLGNEKTKAGDLREAVVVKVGKNDSLLEIGLRERGLLNERLRVGQKLTVRLGERTSGDRILVEKVEKTKVEEYWGYKVSAVKSLSEGLNLLKPDYTVGTSRYGKNLYEAVRGIKDSKPNKVAIAFGGPYAGLFEICERQGVDVNKLFDVMINTIPEQGVATVRTEEALIATLALLNVLVGG